ncbi:MAG: hypothetical protein HC921_12200 [Synechococcaceae cyanobacterium SM2_3_1]|nr:hypothetical protein [Synechococcaceae cyanobacterium SM2_3_1]
MGAQTQLEQDLKQAVEQQDWARAIEIVDQMIEADPGQEAQLRSYREQLLELSGSSPAPTSTPEVSGSIQPISPISFQNGEKAAADVNLLFIGNSHTYFNELDQMVANLMESLDSEQKVLAVRYAPSGYTFGNHQADYNTEGTAIRNWLLTRPDSTPDWDLVVLQPQSQITGFAPSQQKNLEQKRAAFTLHQQITRLGARTMLLMTWGYAEGDSGNPNIYPDYLAMQDRLNQGFLALRSTLAEIREPVLAPVGPAFELVYEDLKKQRQDPLAENSRFRQLYAPDNYHPSLAGSYLAASTVTALFTDRSVAEASWVPDGLDPESAAYLRQVADRAVNQPEWR